jgi:hypothetical protein
MIQLSDDYRVRELDDLQWVLERRSTAEPGRLKRRGGEWKAHAYCRSRAGLETALSRLRSAWLHERPSSVPIRKILLLP